MNAHTPRPWTAVNRGGAGWQIDGVLPAGFKFDSTARGADGTQEFMLWTLRQSITIQIADERWVQFETGPWKEMQEANAKLIAAAPDLLGALKFILAFYEPGQRHLDTEAWKVAEASARAAVAAAEGRAP